MSSKNLNSKKAILLLHGFKKSEKDDFKFFKQYLNKNFPDVKIHFFDYYNSNNKKTMSNKQIKKSVLDFVNKIDSDELYVLGYSLGALISLTLLTNIDKIKKIYCLYPPMKIHFFDWIFKLKENFKKKRKLKKKLGKERFNKLKKRCKKINVLEKHPVRIIFTINNFRILNKHKVSKNLNKDIKIVFSNKDIIVKKSSKKYLEKKLNFKKNNILFSTNNFIHFNVFEFYNSELFEDIMKYFEFLK